MNAPTLKGIPIRVSTETVGGLSDPDKMPGLAWGISPELCKRGSKLRKRNGTICSTCYACKGFYACFDGAAIAWARRIRLYNELPVSVWVTNMANIINRKKKMGHFRVFDAGDLQSPEMLQRWVAVADLCPDTQFWLATRERKMVKDYLRICGPQRLDKGFPPNMVVRVSADMIGGKAPKGFEHTSESCKLSKAQWAEKLSESTNNRYYCPAPMNDNRCGECRACWSRNVATVVYRVH